jgi:hypothetical protein
MATKYYDVMEHGSRFMLASGAKPIKRETGMSKFDSA